MDYAMQGVSRASVRYMLTMEPKDWYVYDCRSGYIPLQQPSELLKLDWQNKPDTKSMATPVAPAIST